MRVRALPAALFALFTLFAVLPFAHAAEEGPVERQYVTAPPSPERQTAEDAAMKSAGCLTCHTATDQPSMHSNPAVSSVVRIVTVATRR